MKQIPYLKVFLFYFVSLFISLSVYFFVSFSECFFVLCLFCLIFSLHKDNSYDKQEGKNPHGQRNFLKPSCDGL